MKAILVDDELNSLQNLEHKIKEYCPQLHIVGMFQKPEEAIVHINSLQPDILFLDIEMPRINGLKLLEKLTEYKGEVIFTTAFQHYAIEAIRLSAFDYLVKPISVSELQSSIERLVNTTTRKTQQRASILAEGIKYGPEKLDKIAVPNNHEIEIIHLNDIVRIEGEGNYSKIVFSTGSSLLITKILKDFEELLSTRQFSRVHNSHLINLNHIKRFIKADGGYIEMTNGDVIDISRRKKNEFLELLLNNNLSLK